MNSTDRHVTDDVLEAAYDAGTTAAARDLAEIHDWDSVTRNRDYVANNADAIWDNTDGLGTADAVYAVCGFEADEYDDYDIPKDVDRGMRAAFVTAYVTEYERRKDAALAALRAS